MYFNIIYHYMIFNSIKFLNVSDDKALIKYENMVY